MQLYISKVCIIFISLYEHPGRISCAGVFQRNQHQNDEKVKRKFREEVRQMMAQE